MVASVVSVVTKIAVNVVTGPSNSIYFIGAGRPPSSQKIQLWYSHGSACPLCHYIYAISSFAFTWTAVPLKQLTCYSKSDKRRRVSDLSAGISCNWKPSMSLYGLSNVEKLNCGHLTELNVLHNEVRVWNLKYCRRSISIILITENAQCSIDKYYCFLTGE